MEKKRDLLFFIRTGKVIFAYCAAFKTFAHGALQQQRCIKQQIYLEEAKVEKGNANNRSQQMKKQAQKQKESKLREILKKT